MLERITNDVSFHSSGDKMENSQNKWARYDLWDERHLNLDRFAVEDPENGFCASASPGHSFFGSCVAVAFCFSCSFPSFCFFEGCVVTGEVRGDPVIV